MKYRCIKCGQREDEPSGEGCANPRWHVSVGESPTGTKEHDWKHRTDFLADDSLYCHDCGGTIAVADG